MATGDEVRKSFASDGTTYSAGIISRNIGGNAAEVLGAYITNKKIDAVSASYMTGSSAHTGTLVGLTTPSPLDIGNSITVAVHCRFGTASAWCELALALYDEAGTLIGVTEKKVITADSSWTDGTYYIAPRVLFDAGEASLVRSVLKQQVSTGSVYIRIEAL